MRSLLRCFGRMFAVTFAWQAVTCLGQVESVTAVPIAGSASQKYSLLYRGEAAGVDRVWVLFTGYDGHAHLGTLDGSPVFLGRGILVDGRRLFLRERNAVAVVDSPSTMPAMSVAFRSSDAYLSGVEQVIASIQGQVPNAKIYLVGASNGSISAVNLATRMGNRIAGVAILGGVFSDLGEFGVGKLKQPVLVIHHKRDGCIPLNFTDGFRERFAPVLVEDIGAHYPSTCGPYSAHHFHGQEAPVIEVLYQWAEGKSAPASLR